MQQNNAEKINKLKEKIKYYEEKRNMLIEELKEEIKQLEEKLGYAIK